MPNQLTTTIATTLDLPPDQITDDLAFNGVKSWDSINHINLMLALEDAFGISIPDDELVELTSVREIRRYLTAQGIAIGAAAS